MMAVGFVLAALASPGVPVGAAPQAQTQFAMSVRAGYGSDGSFVIGEWFPVRVSLVNPGGAPSLRVRVEVDSVGTSGLEIMGSYAREVDLPSPSRKEVTLYATSNGFNRNVEVRVVQGTTVIKSQKAVLNPLEQSNSMLVGVVSSDAGLLNVLKGEKGGHAAATYFGSRYGGSPSPPAQDAALSVAHLALDDLPAVSAALNGLGALVLEDVDTGALSPEQLQAVSAWVARGGTLIVAARPGGSEVSAGLADLLPVRPGGTRSLSSLKALEDLVAVPLQSQALALATESVLRTEPRVAARALATQDGVPLVATRELGTGQVAYLALSPGLAPLRNWDGLVPLFKRLLVEHRVGPSAGAALNGQGVYMGYGPGTGLFDTYGNLFDLPSLDLPEPLVLLLFLLVYIVIIGPINFIILRRIRRPELGWATIPALVLLFSVGAYVIGYGSKGGDLIMVRGTVSQSAEGVREANAIQVWGLFSPTRGNYRLSVGADSVVAALNRYGSTSGTDNNPARVLGGQTTTVENVIVNTFSLKGFVAENVAGVDAPLESDLHLEGSNIEGTLRNRTAGGLQDVALIRGGAVHYVGYMAPGRSVSVKLPVSSRPFDNSSPTSLLPTPPGVYAPGVGGYYGSGPVSVEQRKYNRKVELLSMGLQTLIANEQPTDMAVLAVAWGADPPVRVDVAGQAARIEELNLWTSRLQVAARDGDRPHLNAGLVPYSVYMPQNEPAWSAEIPAGGLSLDPYADITYRLPAGLRPASLELKYKINYATQDVSVLAQNVRTGQWDRLGALDVAGATANNISTLAIPSPADYTGPAGHVTVRLQSNTGKQTVQMSSFDMTLN
jgi:hypothetical protein